MRRTAIEPGSKITLDWPFEKSLVRPGSRDFGVAGSSSLCGRLKRRQRYRWAGLLNFEKPIEQDADSVPRGGRQHSNHDNREWIARSCVVLRTRAH